VLSGRGLCDELITRPEESYRLWCVVVCDLETSRIGAPYIYDISNLRVKWKKYFLTVDGRVCGQRLWLFSRHHDWWWKMIYPYDSETKWQSMNWHHIT
jgi:hypothetical protein